MKQISIGEAQKATSPNPITLVCSKTDSGAANIAAISWWTYLSNRPPMLGFATSDKGYTGQLVRQNKEVAVCLPGEAIAEAAFRCGTVSGRSKDKAEAFGIEMVSLPGVSVQVPAHCKLVFGCTLESSSQAGDHTFYICRINEILYDNAHKQLYAWDGYSSLRPL